MKINTFKKFKQPAAVLVIALIMGAGIISLLNSQAVTSGGSQIYWGARMDGEVYCGGCTNQDAPWYAPTWDTFEAHTGKKVSIEHFGQQAPWRKIVEENTYLDTSALSLVSARGAIPMLSMSSESVSLAAITSGQYDTSLIGWADKAKAYGKPFFLRWNWEMNGTWFNWGAQAKTNPADFVAAWRHFYDVSKARGATNVTWVWCPNTVFTGTTDLAALYPGDAYVDWTCIDGYNFGYRKGPWKSFYDVYKHTYDNVLAVAPAKPILIGEIGSTEAVAGNDPAGVSKAAWITDALNTQLPTNFPQIKALVWFNWNITELVNGTNVTWDWPIESSASSQSSFAGGIASSYYAANNYGNLPLLTKVQPLGTTSPTPLQGDLDADTHVTGHDLSLLLSKFNTTYAAYDLDNAPPITAHDLSILLGNYGK